MPELPDVEGYRSSLARTLPGRRVCQVDVRDAGVLRNTTPRTLDRQLAGHRFTDPRRHGKWLILPTDGPTLLVHSGMTGRPYFAEDDQPEQGWERLVIDLDRGQLRYSDLRKLRGVWLAGDDDEVVGVIGEQGPDAFGLDLRSFARTLQGRRGALKPALMDQSVIAGLGNLLTDEICWRARLNPSRPVSSLDAGDVRRLHTTMKRVLGTARVCAVVAAVAEAGARRTRPYVPTVRCAAGQKPHRRPHLGLVPSVPTRVTARRPGNGWPPCIDDLVMADNCRSVRRGRTVQRQPAGNDVRPAQPRAVRSAVMSSTKRGWLAIAAVVVVGAGAQLIPATALADPDPGPQTDVAPAPGDGLLHNITYRARADGTSRGAVVAYKIDDANVNSDQPTLLPGSTFEVNTVLSNPKLAGMEVSIQWPYGSNLHCEILVDDQIVAQADQFIAPRLLRVKDDPLYGMLQCGAPLDTPVAGQAAPAALPAGAPRSPAA